jgi:MFS family permease
MTSPIPVATSSAAPLPPKVAASRPQRLKRELRWVTTAWLFGSLWMWTSSGACWTQFALTIKTPSQVFGIIAALPYLGILAQLPASYFMTRYGRRRQIFLIFTTIGRLMWVALAAIPWIVPGPSARWWQATIFVLLIAQITMNGSGPAWSSWMADVIPRKIRGRYLGIRSGLGQCVGIATTLFIGWLLDRSAFASPHAMLEITSLLLAVAGISGALDIQCHQFVKDDYPRRADPRAGFWLAIRRALANPDYRSYLAFNFTLQLAVGFTGQYVLLYVLGDAVHMTNKQANMLVIAVPLIAQMLFYPIWGKLVDRVGRKPVLIIAGMITTFASVGWLFIGPDAGGAHPHWRWISIFGYGLIMLTTIAWPGLDVANSNIVMDLLGSRENNSGTAYVAILNLIVGLGGALSGFLAGAATTCFPHGWHVAIPLVGIVLTYHGVLFLASTLVRLSGMGFAFKIHEPRAAGTRQAFMMLTDTVYSNVCEVMLVPTRVVGMAVKWTDKIDYRSIQRLGHRVVGRNDPEP